MKILLQIGACLCALVGAYGLAVIAIPLFTVHRIGANALVVVAFITYSLLAFVPFGAFVYPRLKSPRKSVSFGVAMLEILVVGIFLWVCFHVVEVDAT
jgi:hypothetical protein